MHIHFQLEDSFEITQVLEHLFSKPSDTGCMKILLLADKDSIDN